MNPVKMHRRLAGGAAAAVLAGLCGCSTNTERIILLPDPEGRVGAVIVHSASGERVLDKAYAEVGVGKGGALETTQESQASVQQRYGELLAARPPRPTSFTVHFLFDSATEVAPESQALLETIKATLANWPAPQLMVVGHTDRAGSVESNDKLSLRRAESVKALLIQSGIPAQQIETAGRGEREPLVVTADGVPNLQNRRVVITVQ